VLATYEVDRERGEIYPDQPVRVNVTLRTKRLGKIVLNLQVSIVGHSPPFQLSIEATSTGPEVEVDLKELDFGKVEVLKDWTRTIRLTNKSLIDADFRAFTKDKSSIFKPLQKSGILEANKVLEIQVVCTADDVKKFLDTLYFNIKEGWDVDVQLRA
jgi:hydrocephalus-inducing protein